MKAYEWIKKNKWEFNKALRTSMNLIDEMEYTAEVIDDEAGGEISLLMGSGFGSRAIAMLFKKMDIKFDAITIKTEENEADFKKAENWCEVHNIRHYRIEPKLFHFQCFSDMMKWCISQIDGFKLMGSGFIDLNILPHGEVIFQKRKSDDWIEDFLEKEGTHGCVKFWQSTPEMILSVLKEDMFKEWLYMHKYLKKPDSYWLKPSLLCDILPSITGASEKKINEIFQMSSLSCDKNESNKFSKPLSKALQELCYNGDEYNYVYNRLDMVYKESTFEKDIIDSYVKEKYDLINVAKGVIDAE